MGHLGRAKTTLDSDATVTKQQNKQREATEKAEAEEKSRRELQSLEWKVEHGAALDERDRVSTDIRIAEARLQHAAWMKSRAPFDRRIRTKAQPSLAWLPKRHTDKTRRILEESCDAERAEIVARTAINDEKIRELKAGLEERKLKRKQATEITNAKLEAMQRDGEVERRRRELSHPDERDSVDAAIPEDEKTEGK